MFDRRRRVDRLQCRWVGEWNLGQVDRFEPCNYEGVAGKRDLIVHNKDCWPNPLNALLPAPEDLLSLGSQLQTWPQLVKEAESHGYRIC